MWFNRIRSILERPKSCAHSFVELCEFQSFCDLHRFETANGCPLLREQDHVGQAYGTSPKRGGDSHCDGGMKAVLSPREE